MRDGVLTWGADEPIEILRSPLGRGSRELVFRLLKIAFSLGALAVFTWFGLTVPLGERTFFQHVAAIFRSPESQDLIRGTTGKVGEISRMIRGGHAGAAGHATEAAKAGAGATPVGSAPPAERLSANDRREMRRLLDNAGKPASR